MKNKQIVVMVLAVISTLLIYKSGFVSSRPDEVMVLNQAFNTCGATLQNFQIDGWTHLTTKQNINVLQQAHETIKQLTDGNDITVLVQSETMAKVSIQREQLKIGVIVAKKHLSGNCFQLHQAVHVEIGPKYQRNIEDWRTKVHQTLKNDDIMPVINTCFVGYFDDKLNTSEQHRIIEKLFTVLDAKITDKIETDNYASVAGYSPLIHHHLLVNGNKINVQMAVRYSRYNHGTYVMIGCPVITQEY